MATGEREIEVVMPRADGVALLQRAQTLAGIGANGLQHRPPGASAASSVAPPENTAKRAKQSRSSSLNSS
jgi:hypothetical protein